MNTQLFNDTIADNEMIQKEREKVPLGRFARVEEIASANFFFGK